MDLKMNFKKSRGFTLVELLVVMAILGILFVISLANFRTSQIKARDAQRKSDLGQIANALEAYMTDHNRYPEAVSGKIKACGCGDGTLVCGWGEDPREFCDRENTVYIKEIPDDVTGNPHYCYWSDSASYKLYAKLENNNDPEAKLASSCAGVTYNFGISSGNTTP